MANHELKQIERQLILYDIFQCNDEDTRISTIMHHLPGLSMRTLQRDICDLMDAGLINVYFSRDRNAYINCDVNKDISFYSEGVQRRIIKKREANRKKEPTPRKKEHHKRLNRLTSLMSDELCDNAVEMYFEMFPDATERMRKRDFEIIRHIGFFAGYDREYDDYVIYRREGYGIYDGYGIRIKDGKMVY